MLFTIYILFSRIFGKTLDLHSGGIDLKFPHHENEESQCCAHYNALQWCNYWIHSGIYIYFFIVQILRTKD